MPVHDWTRVSAGTFHDFHQTWLVEMKRALNSGILPPGFYALAEQIAGGLGPDVLALEGSEIDLGDDTTSGIGVAPAAVATAETPTGETPRQGGD